MTADLLARIAGWVADIDTNMTANPGEVIVGEIRDNREYSEEIDLDYVASPSMSQHAELRTAVANFPSGGKWDDTKARIVSDSGHTVHVQKDYTHLHRLQLFQDSTGSSDEIIRQEKKKISKKKY